MILILLFSISSTIRASKAQKLKPKIRCAHAQIFYMERSLKGLPLKIFFFFKCGFFGWVKILKMM